MVSVASNGAAERIAARIVFRVLRAGSGTRARYSSTFFTPSLALAGDLRLLDFTFFMLPMPEEVKVQYRFTSSRRLDRADHRNFRKARPRASHSQNSWSTWQKPKVVAPASCSGISGIRLWYCRIP